MSEISRRGINAVVLAGGRGTRLKPLTAVFPKPLVPLGEKPILEILLRRLANSGFAEVTLCTGYLGELIMAVCGDGERFGLEVRYSHEEGPLGTAGPLAAVEGLSDPFFVMNGDLLTTLNFDNLIRHHLDTQADLTLGIHRREVTIDFGVVQTDELGRFVRYLEKPVYHHEVSMGVNVLSREIHRDIVRGEYLDMPDLVTRTHQSGQRVSCYREDCLWRDIGRIDEYAQAQEIYTENEALFLGESS